MTEGDNPPLMVEPDPNCKCCGGTGVDGDVNKYGEPMDLDCGCRFRHLATNRTETGPLDDIHGPIARHRCPNANDEQCRYPACACHAAPTTNTQTAAQKVVATAPERIWLQVSDDAAARDEPFPASVHGDEVTWCQHSVLDCEVEYVRADIAAHSPAAQQATRLLETLRDDARHAKQRLGEAMLLLMWVAERQRQVTGERVTVFANADLMAKIDRSIERFQQQNEGPAAG